MSGAGRRHPLTLLGEDILGFCRARGFAEADGPELEAQWFNFDALNMAPDHFARAPDHTYYVCDPRVPERDLGLVMRAHTSPVQVREMLAQLPPLRRICVGRTFRPDPLDPTHSPAFHQVEGLAVDRDLDLPGLRSLLDELADAVFGAGTVTRLRPDWFAYAEPAAEIDVRCARCRGRGDGCATCGGEGWIEWGGCGMVHPAVLANCGVGAGFRGYSFGIGLERTLMLREGLDDLRRIVDGDLDFVRGREPARMSARDDAGPLARLGRRLAESGLDEIATFPFLHTDADDRLGLPADDPRRRHARLRKPLPGQGEALRTSLLPGLFDALRRNRERGGVAAAAFEIGRVFHPPAAPMQAAPSPPLGAAPDAAAHSALARSVPPQPRHLGMVFADGRDWRDAVAVAAGAVATLADGCAQTAECPPWRPQRCVALRVGDALVGHVGELDPQCCAAWSLPAGSCAGEIDLDRLVPLSRQELPA